MKQHTLKNCKQLLEYKNYFLLGGLRWLNFKSAFECYLLFLHLIEFKRINCKQIARWQHLSRLKAGAFSL
jgi:hypothetical protein